MEDLLFSKSVATRTLSAPRPSTHCSKWRVMFVGRPLRQAYGAASASACCGSVWMSSNIASRRFQARASPWELLTGPERERKRSAHSENAVKDGGGEGRSGVVE